jgi:hypothetical protein
MASQAKRAVAWASLIVALALTGCGVGTPPGEQVEPPPGTGTGTGTGIGSNGNSNKSPKAKLAQLEASGEIPELDRLPTLQGSDANMNGVRDDIERYIRRKYTEPKQRAAAMQMARATQSAVTVNVRDPLAVNAVRKQGTLAVVCLGDSFTNAEGVRSFPEALTEIESMTTNTKERLLAYLAYAQALSGSVWSLPKGDTCE